MADYPQRESHWAHKLTRLMIRTCAMQDIGVDGYALVSIIAHTEDAKRYTAPVTFWNIQLMSIMGLSMGRIDRARKHAITHGWLHYEPGGKGRVGRYWTTMPGEFADIPDGSVECGYPNAFLLDFGEDNGRQPLENRERTVREP